MKKQKGMINLIKNEYNKLHEDYKKKKLKKTIIDLLIKNKSPHKLAIGFSVGIFLSIIPSFSLGMWISLFLALKLKWNIVSTYLGTLIVNPLNSILMYSINYSVGTFVLGITPFEKMGFSNIILPIYVGGLLIAIVVSVSSYFIITTIARRFQNAV